MVSIITPVYNASRFISDMLSSVLNQTYTNWEVLLVDDCSKDNSVEIIEKIIEENPNRKISLIKNNKNSGPALTRNRAIKMAKGRYLAFLDSDDLWLPQKLEEQIGFMKTNNYYFTCSYFNKINEDGEYLGKAKDIPSKISYEFLLKANRIGCLTSIYDVNYFGKIYMDNISKRQDYGLWLKLLKKVEYAYCYPKILAEYRVLKNSVSSNKISLIKYHWFIYFRHEKLGFLKSVYYTINYVLQTLFSK